MARPGLDLSGLGDPTDLPTVIEFLKQLRADFDAHNHDGFNSRSFDNLIIRSLISQGLIVGSSIYIPDIVNPKFSVDSFGNVKVLSLERRDFHWYTVFESLDGYSQSFTGAGTIAIGYQFWESTTGINNGDRNYLVKSFPSAFGSTWDKDRKFKTGVNPVSGSANYIGYIVTGDGSIPASGNHVGFKVVGASGSTYDLWATIGNGSTETVLHIGTYNYGTYILLEARYFAGKRVDFYVNDVLSSTISVNLPSGTTSAGDFIQVNLKTTGGAQALRMTFWDYWQAT